MYAKRMSPTLIRNQIQPYCSGMNGPCQPPRYKSVATADIVTMLMYSACGNSAKRTELYSVLKPATSSCSASGKSNGARLVSATPAITYMMNPTGCRKMYHCGRNPNQWPLCESTTSRNDSEPASRITDASEVAYASS